ncbi:unnamed protein product [Urochloa decumbens]|uniref:C2H2-type domain-containing protein n=1 Tax=Urochloa decumbens TaxID=240449 RepID=A0ABC9BD74_9POAL
MQKWKKSLYEYDQNFCSTGSLHVSIPFSLNTAFISAGLWRRAPGVRAAGLRQRTTGLRACGGGRGWDSGGVGVARAAHRPPSSSAARHAQVAADALRRELLKERIREEIFATGRRNSEPEVRRELRMEHAVPHHGMSPVRQADRLQRHTPLSLELRLGETIETPGAVKSRRPVKDRLSGWNRSPWHDRSADPASSCWARLPKKTLSGLKRKGIAENSFARNENSFEKWSCALCHVNLYSEFSFMEHCAGPLHQSTLAYMEWTKQTTGLKRIVTADPYPRLQHNPTAWNCSTCQVRCSSESELKNHLNGRRHQENAEALWRESGEIGGKRWLQEDNSSQPVYKYQRQATKWNCSICKVSGASEFGLENHLQGQRHQQNVTARFV